MNKILKRTLQGIVGAAIISGTYLGKHQDDFPPFYSHKTGDSYGINVSFYTEIEEGASINGANVSLVTINDGAINGLNATIGTSHDYKSIVNGLEIGLLNFSGKNSASTFNGVQIGVANSDPEASNSNPSADLIHNDIFHGVQIGLFNSCGNVYRDFKGVQIGLGNSADNIKGVQIGVANIPDTLTGLSIGLVNKVKQLNGTQIGVYNKSQNHEGVLLNVDYDGGK